jgi:hypothetical protein
VSRKKKGAGIFAILKLKTVVGLHSFVLNAHAGEFWSPFSDFIISTSLVLLLAVFDRAPYREDFANRPETFRTVARYSLPMRLSPTTREEPEHFLVAQKGNDAPPLDHFGAW